jgi:hypothetical protein
MNHIITFGFLLLSFSAFSQNFINKTKKQVKKELTEYITRNDSLNATLNETDTAITLTIKGTKTLAADFIYRFDKTGKCKSEKVMSSCDSCLNKYLAAALARKNYEWRKINGNQYISNFASRMLIELPGDTNNFSYIILRTDWSKQMYDLLTGN